MLVDMVTGGWIIEIHVPLSHPRNRCIFVVKLLNFACRQISQGVGP
ncbi:hypothetical protein DE4585_04542 [Mycobacteroides salmoniphilum]|uniref:Uncharacterized protein n=1 Tax=Mycobacteroides salmoniphilum TaxID=404941 RepID=A0A4R8RWZ7_9MYCO|nr:hypothetical protein DE4585_04542 [Mycobacteroides salmoniphilum]